MSATPVFNLPERIDQTFLPTLVQFLDQNGHQDVVVSARDLRQFDMTLAQILLVAKRERRAQGQVLRLEDLTPAHRHQIAIAGLSRHLDETAGQ